MIYSTSPEDFNAKIWDQRYDVLDILHISEHVDRIVRRLRPELTKAPKTNNLVAASYVPSHSRLRLYHFIEQVDADVLNCKLLYSDTDSVLYMRKEAATGGIQEGEQLGDMKREYEDRRIIEFFAGGPKNYGYKHVNAADGSDEKMERKIRGFELNYQTSEKLHYEAMKQQMIDIFTIDGLL